MAATVVLNLLAKAKKVSPDLIVYSKVPAGHLPGPGPVPGIQITWPIWRLFGSTLGLAAWIAATVVLNLLAKEKKVSPALMVYSKVPAGHLGG